jgi:polysaccharide export outer membrane protein
MKLVSTSSRRAIASRFATRVAGLVLALPLVTGCASDGAYVWYTQLQRSEWGHAPQNYLINVGDMVNIRVYGQEGLTAVGKIRRDGRIAMPLVGEVEVAGRTPAEVARDLEGKLKPFVNVPQVTVNVDQSQTVQVSALGEVNTKGVLSLEPPAVLLEALAQAGGLTDFADKSRIFVSRQVPKWERIRFTYDAIIHNENGAATFPLRTGDVIIVE